MANNINNNKLTLTNIDNILDNHIENSTDLLFVCDHGLASYICEYLEETYDIFDDDMEITPYIKEYYVSLLFDGEEIQFFCESAKANDGDYKYSEFCDPSFGDYFIFTDMSEDIAYKTLNGNATWSFCELVEEVVIEDADRDNGNMMLDTEDICPVCGEVDCDCGECMCNDCRSQRHDDIVNASVGKAFEKIMKSEGCPNCIIDALMEMSLEMKRLGWADHKDYITECNG